MLGGCHVLIGYVQDRYDQYQQTDEHRDETALIVLKAVHLLCIMTLLGRICIDHARFSGEPAGAYGAGTSG